MEADPRKSRFHRPEDELDVFDFSELTRVRNH